MIFFLIFYSYIIIWCKFHCEIPVGKVVFCIVYVTNQETYPNLSCLCGLCHLCIWKNLSQKFLLLLVIFYTITETQSKNQSKPIKLRRNTSRRINLFACSQNIKNLAYNWCGMFRILRFCVGLIHKLTHPAWKLSKIGELVLWQEITQSRTMQCNRNEDKKLDWEPLEIRRKATRATLFHEALAGHLAIPM